MTDIEAACERYAPMPSSGWLASPSCLQILEAQKRSYGAQKGKARHQWV